MVSTTSATSMKSRVPWDAVCESSASRTQEKVMSTRMAASNIGWMTMDPRRSRSPLSGPRKYSDVCLAHSCSRNRLDLSCSSIFCMRRRDARRAMALRMTTFWTWPPCM